MFVGEHQQGHFRKEFLGQQLDEVVLNFLNAHLIGGVDHVDKSISLVVVVPPVRADLTLTTDVPNVQLKTVLRLGTAKKILD